VPEPSNFTFITGAMQAAVGREITRFVSHPISVSDIRKWLIAVYWPEPPPPLQRAGDGTVLAPEEFNPFAWSAAAGDRSWHTIGHDPETYLGIARPAVSATVNGGIEVEYGARLRADDVITAVSHLAGYSERDGRRGRLLFRTVEELWTNQDAVLIKRVRLTLISY
jgi:MaoC dehydratase-like protein